jgi:membrane-associated phospholipid phosphatase
MLGTRGLVNTLKRARTVAVCLCSLLCGASSAAHAEDAQRLEWNPEWRRVNLWEGLALLPTGGVLLALATQITPPKEPNWRGGILADELARDWLRGRTPDVQDAAAKVSNLLFIGGTIAPVLIDAGVVALGIHRNPDVALQIFLIDLQSLSVSGLISLTSEYTVGRTRPYVEDCGADGAVRDASGRVLGRCSAGRDTKSFYSGHAAATATVAGLTCLHHQHMPLYGGGFADLLPCLVTIAVSATTGITRIIADAHWTSDVIIGWTIGSLSGYLLPALIHYGFSDGQRAWAQNLRVAPLPQVFSGGVGLGIAGDF